MKKWCSLLVIFMFIFSLVDFTSADELTGEAVTDINFGNIINNVVNSIKDVFKTAVGIKPEELNEPITPRNLQSTVESNNVILTWEEVIPSQDTTKPSVTLISPINDPTYLVNTQIEFTCSASDLSGISRIEFWLTAPTGGFNLDEIRDINEDASTVTVVFTKAFNKVGNYAWSCKAYDKNGNNAYGSVNGQSPGFHIRKELAQPGPEDNVNETDTTPVPAVTLISPIDNPVYAPNAQIEFTCSASPPQNAAIERIELWLGEPSKPFHIEESKAISDDTPNAPVKFTKSLLYEVGDYTWNCKAYDSNGNSAFGSVNGQLPAFRIESQVSDYMFLGYKLYKIDLNSPTESIQIITDTRGKFNCNDKTCSYKDANLNPSTYRYYLRGVLIKNGLEKLSVPSNVIDVTVQATTPPGGGGGTPTSGGGGGGRRSGGGSGIAICYEQWLCGAWSTCTSNIQTRDCIDLRKCNNAQLKVPKPSQSRTCINVQAGDVDEELQPSDEQIGEIEQPSDNNALMKQIASIALLVIILAGIILLIVFRKKIFRKKVQALQPEQPQALMVKETKKPAEPIAKEYADVINAIANAKRQGFGDNDIVRELNSKGWTQEQIDYIMKRV